jgi:hypothetical protein
MGCHNSYTWQLAGSIGRLRMDLQIPYSPFFVLGLDALMATPWYIQETLLVYPFYLS